MILRREILSKAEDWGGPANTVDKDYVLGHFLNSFHQFGNNHELFVSKAWSSSIAHHLPQHQLPEFDEVRHYYSRYLFVRFLQLDAH